MLGFEGRQRLFGFRVEDARLREQRLLRDLFERPLRERNFGLGVEDAALTESVALPEALERVSCQRPEAAVVREAFTLCGVEDALREADRFRGRPCSPGFGFAPATDGLGEPPRFF